MTNRLVAPINQKEVLLSRMASHALCVKRDCLTDATIRIQKCHDVQLYFAASMKHVAIEGCKDSTFVLGAVSGIAKIADCTNCTFILTARVLHASNLTDCKFNLATPMSPILNGYQINTELAPFNTKYVDLETDTVRAGILKKPNNWQTPYIIDSPGQTVSWRLTPVNDFFYYVIPYTISKECDHSSFLFPIPIEYKEEVHRKIQAKKSWKAQLRQGDREHSALMRSLVKLEFNKWLAENGHERDINMLSQE